MDDDDSNMRKLVEIILDKKVTILSEMEPHNSSGITQVAVDDFLKKMEDVLFFRQQIVSCRWNGFIDAHSLKMSSCGMYLNCVMVACLYEHVCNRNIFDSFVSVCTLVINLSEETLQKTGVNFCDLNTDIIMVFYQYALKKKFQERGGFPHFGKYIREHRYFEWNLKRDYTLPTDPTAFVFKKELYENIEKELSGSSVTLDEKSRMQAIGKSLAEKVLPFSSVKLPILPGDPDLTRTLIPFEEKKLETKTEMQSAAVESGTSNAGLFKHSSLESNSNSIPMTTADVSSEEKELHISSVKLPILPSIIYQRLVSCGEKKIEAKPEKQRGAVATETSNVDLYGRSSLNSNSIPMEPTGLSTAEQVFSSTSVELSIMPGEPDQIRRQVPFGEKKIEAKPEKQRAAVATETSNVDLYGLSSLNSNSIPMEATGLLAQKVFPFSSFKLPILPSDPDLTRTLIPFEEKKLETKTEMQSAAVESGTSNAVLYERSSLDSNSNSISMTTAGVSLAEKVLPTSPVKHPISSSILYQLLVSCEEKKIEAKTEKQRAAVTSETSNVGLYGRSNSDSNSIPMEATGLLAEKELPTSSVKLPILSDSFYQTLISFAEKKIETKTEIQRPSVASETSNIVLHGRSSVNSYSKRNNDCKGDRFTVKFKGLADAVIEYKFRKNSDH